MEKMEEESNVGSMKKVDTLQKENKFMSEQIRRLSEEKIKIERKAG